MKKFLLVLGVCLFPWAAHAASEELAARLAASGGAMFPIGAPNDRLAQYFTGPSYVAPLCREAPAANVTFERGAHTVWHIHHGTCQLLLGVSGRGAYQIWGQPAQKLEPGDSVTIPAGVKHWHGAAPDSDFQHIAVMEAKPGIRTEWLEPVDERELDALRKR